MHKKKEKVCVIGLGYIGLPTATLLATQGYEVVGVDINPEIVRCIQASTAHITEADLDKLLEKAVSTGKLRATTECEPADIFIIGVPTPLNPDKTPDLSAVEAAFDSVAPHLKKGDLIILESTCPVGATDAMVRRLANKNLKIQLPSRAGNGSDPDINVAYCPERVLPGQIIKELVYNDRVIGGITPACTNRAINFYRTFVKAECHPTDSKTAELCKLSENSFRDVNIAFANELSMICEEHGIDEHLLIRLANHHPRVNILSPGPGVGGHCIAIDPWFLASNARAPLVKAARIVNDYKREFVVDKIEKLISSARSRSKKNIKVGLYGLSYKSNTSDLRESPALYISNRLASNEDIDLYICEPNVRALPNTLSVQGVKLCRFEELIKIAEVNVFLVMHDEFVEGLDKAGSLPRMLIV